MCNDLGMAVSKGLEEIVARDKELTKQVSLQHTLFERVLDELGIKVPKEMQYADQVQLVVEGISSHRKRDDQLQQEHEKRETSLQQELAKKKDHAASLQQELEKEKKHGSILQQKLDEQKKSVKKLQSRLQELEAKYAQETQMGLQEQRAKVEHAQDF